MVWYFCPKNLDMAVTVYILRAISLKKKLNKKSFKYKTGHSLGIQRSTLGLHFTLKLLLLWSLFHNILMNTRTGQTANILFVCYKTIEEYLYFFSYLNMTEEGIDKKGLPNSYGVRCENFIQYATKNHNVKLLSAVSLL